MKNNQSGPMKGFLERETVASEIVNLASMLWAHASACDSAPLPISIAHSEGGIAALRALSIQILGRVPDEFPGEEFLQKEAPELEDCVC